jgi:hemolysin activation/secretion protein
MGGTALLEYLYDRPRGRSGRGVARLCVGVLSAVGGLGAMPAAAQQQPPALPTRDELDPFDSPQPPPRPKLAIDGDVERAPCALADPAYANIKVTLSQATFHNLGPVSAADLRTSYASYLGREQPISVVCDIRDSAATLLRQRGYIAAVQVPTQRIENGAVTFEILYAKVTTLRVLGKPGRNERLFESYLKPLAQGQVFNRRDAERAILLARDVPGYDVRLSLKPAGTGPGEMIGEVTLRPTQVIADFNLQNYAARDTGRVAGQLRVQLNGLTGLGDRTLLSVYSTSDFKEQQIVQVGHDMLIGGHGLRVGGRMTYAWTHPTLGGTTPDVRARTLFANLEASYPLVRRQAATVRAALGVDFVNQRVSFGGAPLSRDRLRVGYFRLDGDAIDLSGNGPDHSPAWRVSGALEVRQGLNILNASPNCLATPLLCRAAGFAPPSLPDGNPTASVVRFSGVADLHITKTLTVSISPRGQVSSSSLLAFEQFSTGNYTVGRGFDPGAIVGDSGVGFQTELRVEGFRLVPKADVRFSPYAFADNAWVWNRGAGAINPQRLSSVGGGVRISWADRARLDLTVAVPTRDLPGETTRRDVRFLASLTANILPWRTR